LTDLFPDVPNVGDVLIDMVSESFKAQNAITKGQLVKISTHTAGEISSVDVAGAGDKAIGMAKKTVVAGEQVPVLRLGKAKITAGGAITTGAAIKAGATGKAVAAVRTVTIPSGATTVTSTSAQPSMTVEGGLACGTANQTTAADGDTFIADINGFAP